MPVVVVMLICRLVSLSSEVVSSSQRSRLRHRHLPEFLPPCRSIPASETGRSGAMVCPGAAGRSWPEFPRCSGSRWSVDELSLTNKIWINTRIHINKLVTLVPTSIDLAVRVLWKYRNSIKFRLCPPLDKNYQWIEWWHAPAYRQQESNPSPGVA